MRFLFLLLILPWQIGHTQNLVPNPSFEEVTEITNHWSGTFSKFNRRIALWDSPTQGSPDILFIKTLDKMHPKRPKVDLAPHQPRTGKFMLGIKAYGCASRTLHCKEYIQVKLREALIPGEQYAFEFWLNPITTSIKVNNFGITLEMERVKEVMVSGRLEVYPVATETRIIDGQPNEWQRIAGVFTADEAYQYLIIGNFYEDDIVDAKVEPYGLDYAYYLIDDVSLRPLKAGKPRYAAGETLVLENIAFAFNKAELQKSAHEMLSELAGQLQEKLTLDIEIGGHTDNIGDATYNLELSQRRAEAVRAYLINQGIAAERILAQGFGSQQPLVDNTTEEQRQLNRRVEIKLK